MAVLYDGRMKDYYERMKKTHHSSIAITHSNRIKDPEKIGVMRSNSPDTPGIECVVIVPYPDTLHPNAACHKPCNTLPGTRRNLPRTLPFAP